MNQERLVQLLDYCPDTGVFTRRLTTCNRAKKGAVAGCLKSNGYVAICVDKRYFTAHRLAWLYVTGSWPNGQIDHINGVRHDNRIKNLRDVSHSVNQQNQRVSHADSKSGILGVTWYKPTGKWVASLTINKRTKYIGCFDDKDQARLAYIESKRQHHEGNTL